MKNLIMFFGAMALLTACFSSTHLEGEPTEIRPTDCFEEECDDSIRSLMLPAPSFRFDLATDGQEVVIAWQEAATDVSLGYVGMFDPADPPEELDALMLDTTDVGIRNPQLLWFDDSPRVFWTRYDGSQGRLMSSTLFTSTHVLSPATTMYDDHHASLGEVVHHSSGEIALSWSEWEDASANPQAFFGRFTEEGALIDLMEISGTDYAYGPRIDMVSDGYSFTFTQNDDSAHRNVMSSSYSFVTGIDEFVQVNDVDGRFSAIDLAVTPAMNIVLWQMTPNPEYPHLNLVNVSWVDLEGVRSTVLLDEIVAGADMLSLPSEETAMVSWCSMDAITMDTKLNVARLSSGSLSTAFYANLGEVRCDRTRLLKIGDHVSLFWMSSGSQIVRYKALCS